MDQKLCNLLTQQKKHETARHTSYRINKKTPNGKDCYRVYINYLEEAFNTNKFPLCKETLALETNLFATNEEIDLDKLHQFLSGITSNKQNDMRRQAPMDFKKRTNLMESRTSAYCNLIKTIQVFNSIISTNPASAQQFQTDFQRRLGPIYTQDKSN